MSHGRNRQWRPSGRSNHTNLRREVFIRDNFTCQLCGRRAIWPHKPRDYTGDYAVKFADGKSLTVDHIVEMNRGGKNSLGNLRALCQKCNSDRNEGKKQPQVGLLERHGLYYDNESELWKFKL